MEHRIKISIFFETSTLEEALHVEGDEFSIEMY